MTVKDLTKLVRTELDKYEYYHPFVNSDKFRTNSYRKWACRELLRFIRESEELPFRLVPQEILEQFIAKMLEYALLNEKNGEPFVVASEMGEFFKEETYRRNLSE